MPTTVIIAALVGLLELIATLSLVGSRQSTTSTGAVEHTMLPMLLEAIGLLLTVTLLTRMSHHLIRSAWLLVCSWALKASCVMRAYSKEEKPKRLQINLWPMKIKPRFSLR